MKKLPTHLRTGPVKPNTKRAQCGYSEWTGSSPGFMVQPHKVEVHCFGISIVKEAELINT